MRDKAHFATIEEALEEMKAGRMVVVVDDEDRENEGDLTMAAAASSPQRTINFIASQRPGPHLPGALTEEKATESCACHPMARENSVAALARPSPSPSRPGRGSPPASPRP